jgi:hypothetical protein
MLTAKQLNDLHTIYWSVEENLYRRGEGGKSEFGYRTDDIFGVNIYENPEKYEPSGRIELKSRSIYEEVKGTICVCGCSKCSKLFKMRHIETEKELAVGSSCIKKARGHIMDMYKDNDDIEIIRVKKEYDKFNKYINDKIKLCCYSCLEFLYTGNKKDHKKNITDTDYNNAHSNLPYCYKCDKKYKNNPKCLNCKDRIVSTINEYSDNFCLDCSKKELKFGLNIKYDEKDEYKKKYNVKWDCDNKMWYKITTFEKISPALMFRFRTII